MTAGDAPVVLVVEDDPAIRTTILRCLRGFGFDARNSVDRAEILAQVASGSCAAILLDLGLPGDDGIEIARAVRRASAVPILMLTGRARISERVAGLEAGADDYIVKPFAEDELVARLRAVLRRTSRPASPAPGPDSYRIGDVLIAFEAREFAGPQGRERLTAQELRLLRALIDSGGTLGRSAAYRFVFQRDWQPTDRALDVHVANLRRKLVRAGGASDAIVTLRGQGYLLRGVAAADQASGR